MFENPGQFDLDASENVSAQEVPSERAAIEEERLDAALLTCRQMVAHIQRQGHYHRLDRALKSRMSEDEAGVFLERIKRDADAYRLEDLTQILIKIEGMPKMAMTSEALKIEIDQLMEAYPAYRAAISEERQRAASFALLKEKIQAAIASEKSQAAEMSREIEVSKSHILELEAEISRLKQRLTPPQQASSTERAARVFEVSEPNCKKSKSAANDENDPSQGPV